MRTEARQALEEPARELIEAGFALEIADAPFLHRGLNLADIVHCLALWERGVIQPDPAKRLLRLLLYVYGLPAEEFPYDPNCGEAYHCRERFFAERLGTDAGWLHAGRPRREAGRIALRLLLRRLVAGLIEDLAGFVDALSTLAAANADTVMADQTNLREAQPSTFGHYALTFAYPALRDCDRLRRDLDWVNRSPGGAGCVNGSRLHLDRDLVADLLGFDGVIVHTRDAMWQTDGLVDLLATAAGVVTNLSQLAEDLEIWGSQEFDFVQVAAPYTRASVLMPQKRNPYALSIVRGAAGVLIGRLTGLLAVVKTPSARSDNLIFAYGELPRSLELAGRVTRLMRGVVATLRVDPERMRESLLAGFSQATDLAELVMQVCDLDYRSAYQVVGTAVRQANRRGLRGVDLTADMLDEAAQEQLGYRLGLVGTDLSDVLDPRSIVLTRVLPGGAAPHVVRRMAAECHAGARRARAEAADRRRRFDLAEEGLVRVVRERVEE